MASCALTGTIQDTSGTAKSGVLVMARAVVPQPMASDTLVASRDWVTTTTNGSGVFSLNVEQGSKVRVVCAEIGLDRVFEVPSQSTYDLAKEL